MVISTSNSKQNDGTKPQEILKKKESIGNSYSIKYFGETDGKMGMLSRRIPIKKRTMGNDIKTSIKIKHKNICKSHSFDLYCNSAKIPGPTNIVNYDINDYTEELFPTESNPSDSQKTSYIKKKSQIKSKQIKPIIKRTMLQHQRSISMISAEGNTLILSSSVPSLKFKITEKKPNPKAEEVTTLNHMNQIIPAGYLVHTYCLPNTLTSQKKKKVVNGLEEICFCKKNYEHHNKEKEKINEMRATYGSGFKGRKLTQALDKNFNQRRIMSRSEQRRTFFSIDCKKTQEDIIINPFILQKMKQTNIVKKFIYVEPSISGK